jgi:hypothetical protein
MSSFGAMPLARATAAAAAAAVVDVGALERHVHLADRRRRENAIGRNAGRRGNAFRRAGSASSVCRRMNRSRWTSTPRVR